MLFGGRGSLDGIILRSSYNLEPNTSLLYVGHDGILASSMQLKKDFSAPTNTKSNLTGMLSLGGALSVLKWHFPHLSFWM